MRKRQSGVASVPSLALKRRLLRRRWWRGRGRRSRGALASRCRDWRYCCGVGSRGSLFGHVDGNLGRRAHGTLQNPALINLFGQRLVSIHAHPFACDQNFLAGFQEVPNRHGTLFINYESSIGDVLHLDVENGTAY